MSLSDYSRIINEISFHILKSSDKGQTLCIPSLGILESLKTILKFTNSNKVVEQIDQLLQFNTEEKNKSQDDKVKLLADLIDAIFLGDNEYKTVTLQSGICITSLEEFDNSSDVKQVNVYKDEESIRKLNSEISELTGNRIKEFLTDHNKPKSGITLFNMTYITANFCTVYLPDSTEIKDFHVGPSKTIKIPMLSSGGMLMYNDDKEVGVRVMYHSFNGCNYSVLVLVPMKKFGLEEMEQKLTSQNYSGLISNMRPVLGSLTMPKLSLNMVSDLSGTFKKCGLTDLFDSSAAQLTKIVKSITAVDHFIEGISINLNEFGSNIPKRPYKPWERCANCCGGFTTMPEQQSIIANEPFLLIINNHNGDAIVSINRVMEPIPSE